MRLGLILIVALMGMPSGYLPHRRVSDQLEKAAELSGGPKKTR